MIFTLVGSRDCKEEEYKFFVALSAALVASGNIIYTGDADGIDKASREGATAVCREMRLTTHESLKNFMPSAGHRGFQTSRVNLDVSKDRAWKAAKRIAAKHHPAMSWMVDDQLDNYTGLSDKLVSLVNLMTRNVFQVYGEELSLPTDCVLCCAPPKSVDQLGLVSDVEGGTGQAVRLAYASDTLVLNLRQEGHKEKIIELILNAGVNSSHLEFLKGLMKAY